MKTLARLGALIAIVGFVVVTVVDKQVEAQLPQSSFTIAVNDYAVLDDSTGDSTFNIAGSVDHDTSQVYDGYLMKGITLQGYTDQAHADSAGATIYTMGSVTGVAGAWTYLDSLLLTVDESYGFSSVDLRAGRYRYIRYEIHGVASTDSSSGTEVYLRVFRWSDR